VSVLVASTFTGFLSFLVVFLAITIPCPHFLNSGQQWLDDTKQMVRHCPQRPLLVAKSFSALEILSPGGPKLGEDALKNSARDEISNEISGSQPALAEAWSAVQGHKNGRCIRFNL
jgi:hypothetical protein